MTDRYHARQKERAEREQYKLAAREMVKQFEDIERASLTIKVGEHAHVQPCEGGAFVEATIWVPAVYLGEVKNVQS